MQTNPLLYESDDHKNNKKPWNCHICTFANDWKSTRCKMCFTNQKDDYTKGLESQIQKLELENNGLKFEIEKSKEELLELDKLKEELKIKDEENIGFKFRIEKLKEEVLEMDNLKEQIYELECQIKQQSDKINNKKEQIVINNYTEQKHNQQNYNKNVSEAKKREPEKVTVMFQGYMLMRNKLNSNYEKLWFLFCSNNTVTYYANVNEITELPLGVINLYLVTNIKEYVNNNTFDIITPKRTYSLRVIDLEQYKEWINVIKLSVSPSIICKGYLYKKKERKLNNKSWNRRYYILCHNYSTKCNELRYYENETCMKYKGNINCNDIKIKDITFLPNATKLQQYGKDLLLELTTKHRIYIFAAENINSKRLWYESFKKVSDMPRISHSRNVSSSMTIPSIPPTPKKKKNNNNKLAINMGNSNSNNRMFGANQIKQLLAPISESGKNIMQQSHNNYNIQSDEWGDCMAELSLKLASPDPSDDGIAMSYNNFTEDSYMKTSPRNASPRNEMSYMSQNTVMLMDINKENRPKLNVYAEYNNSMDSANMDMESSTTTSFNLEEQSRYAQSVHAPQMDADTVVHAPFNINAFI